VLAALCSVLLSFSLATPSFGASVAVAADQAAIDAQTLTLANLPQGWRTAAESTSGGATESCADMPFGASDRIAEVEASFEDPSDLPVLLEQIAVFSSTSTVFKHGVRAIDRCHTVSINEGGTEIKIRLAKLGYPGGKETAAYSLKFKLQGKKVGIDLVVEEIGNEIAQVGVADVPGPSLSEVEKFVSKAVNKIKHSPPAPG